MQVRWVVATVAVFVAGQAEAGLITDPSSFSGTETVVTFSSPAKGNSFTIDGITFENHAAGELESNGPFDRGVFFGKPVDDGQLNDFVSQSDFSIHFGTTVNRVGMVLSNASSTTWYLDAYDANNSLLGTESFTSVQRDVGPEVGNPWPIYAAPVFAGIEYSEGISRVRVYETSSNGQITLLDDLRFEAVSAVPEPSSIALIGIGGMCLVGSVIHQRRKTNSRKDD